MAFPALCMELEALLASVPLDPRSSRSSACVRFEATQRRWAVARRSPSRGGRLPALPALLPNQNPPQGLNKAVTIQLRSSPAHRDGAEGVLVSVHDVGVRQVGAEHCLEDAALACGGGVAVRRGGAQETSAVPPRAQAPGPRGGAGVTRAPRCRGCALYSGRVCYAVLRTRGQTLQVIDRFGRLYDLRLGQGLGGWVACDEGLGARCKG